MRASEFKGILPIENFGFKAGQVVRTPQAAQQQQSQQPQSSIQSQPQVQPLEQQVQKQSEQSLRPKTSTGVGTVSLMGAINKIKERNTQTTVNQPQLGTDTFNESAVRNAVEQFAESKSNDSELFILLKSIDLIVNGSIVTFVVDSKYSEQLLIPYKQRIESAIATFVNNRDVVVEIKIEAPETSTVAKPVYVTASERLNLFIELNPVVAEFVDLLGLEVE